MNSNSTTVSRVSLLSLSAFVAFAWLATDALFSGPAQAAPPSTGTCSITSYYSDANKTKEVGTFSTCPSNRGLRGRRTRYYDVETVDMGNPGPEERREREPRSLPCEFLAEGCGHLPRPR